MYEPLRKRLDAFSPSTSMESLQDTWGPLLPPGSAFVPGAGKNYLASKRGTNRKTANSAMMPSSGSMFSSPAPFLPEFACHRAGTKVLMADGTRTPIEDVRVGDRVIDKDGHIQTVLNAWCSGIPTSVTEIKLWGGKTFYSTHNHKWPVARTSVEGALVYNSEEKTRADDVRRGDFFLMPRKFDAVAPEDIAPGLTISPDVARLVGYYTAEGSVSRTRADLPVSGVDLTFGIHEKRTWAEDVAQIYDSLGIDANMAERKSCVRVRTNTQRGRDDRVVALAQWLAQSVGVSSLSKAFSEEIMRWPLELKRELAIGAFRGDGSQTWRVSSKNGYEGRSFCVMYSTVSETLVAQMQLILAQLGIPCRIAVTKAAARAMPNGKTYNCVGSYILTVPAPFAFDFAREVWGAATKGELFPRHQREGWTTVAPRVRVDESYVYLPVRSVTTVANDVPVYNLTVSGDHSYVVDNVGTFNSPDRLSYPVHRILANNYWRLYYKLDPDIGTGIDILSELPWGDFELTGEGVTGEIKDRMDLAVEVSKLKTALPYMQREFPSGQ